MLVKCQYTGIEFEAKSKRQKNHPAVSELLSEANKAGTYGVVVERLRKAREAGMEDIEEVLEFARTGSKEVLNRRNERAAAERQASKDRADASRRREVVNAKLREHGYVWWKDYHYDFDHYEEPDETYIWRLSSPDGREVTERQALDEIERGSEVVLAEIAEKEQAQAQKKELVKAEKEAEIDRLEVAKNSVKSIEVESFDYSSFEKIYEYKRNITGGQIIDQVFAGKINGVRCGVVRHYFGGHDFDDYQTYYCENPAAAGLEEIEKRDGLSQTLHDFYGG